MRIRLFFVVFSFCINLWSCRDRGDAASNLATESDSSTDDEAEMPNGWCFMGCKTNVEACNSTCSGHRANAELDPGRCDPYKPDSDDGGLACFCQMSDAGLLGSEDTQNNIETTALASTEWQYMGCKATVGACEAGCAMGHAYAEEDGGKCASDPDHPKAPAVACYCRQQP